MSLIGCMLSHSVCFLADDLAESTDHLWFSICVAPFYMLYILNIAELLISSYLHILCICRHCTNIEQQTHTYTNQCANLSSLTHKTLHHGCESCQFWSKGVCPNIQILFLPVDWAVNQHKLELGICAHTCLHVCSQAPVMPPGHCP